MSAEPEIAMTPQQRRLTSDGAGGFYAYKTVMAGDHSWGSFFGFELCKLLLTNLDSFIGIGLRRVVYPWFFERCSRGLAVGRGVTVRQPQKISLGKKVMLDDYASVDVRTRPGQDQNAFVSLGDYVYVGRNSIVSAKYGQITLGNAVNIGSGSRIATRETIEIGESVLIASYVYIGAGNHRTDDINRPVMEQEMELKGGVKIGANTWIGTRATICDGVTIGKDAIIGAHSLVREDVPDRAIVAGTPAKLIRYRE